jgi:uncharacterized membrane protein
MPTKTFERGKQMLTQTNLINASVALAKLLNIRVTAPTIRKNIEQNTNYPSLLSLSDTFNRFKIPNESFRLGADQLKDIEGPFIAFWKNDFVLVRKIENEKITYEDTNGKTVTTPISEFAREYGKIIFVAEPDEHSGEPDYEKNARKERKDMWVKISLAWGTAAIVLLLFGQFIFNSLNLNSSEPFSLLLITVTKLAGLASAILLLTFEVDKNNTLVKSICTAGKQTSCEAVLNSKASHLLGMSWSEIGFFYFATTTLFLLYPGLSMTLKTVPLAWIATTAAPYVLFSIYYQWRVVKRWCPLCLAVQSVLILELVWSVFSYWYSNETFEFTSAVIIPFLLCLLTPVVAWNFIKPVWTKSKEAHGFEASYKRLLYNPEMFFALLNQQSAAPEGWENIGITLGNPAAKNSIIKVCNPFCGPCAKAHPVLDEIVHNNPQYNLKVIFTSTNEPQDRGGYVARHLLAIAQKGNHATTQQAMDDWYQSKTKDYQNLTEKYPLNGEVEKQKEKLDNMGTWCKEAGIAYTPTIFINGRKLPETYSIEELKNIL